MKKDPRSALRVWLLGIILAGVYIASAQAAVPQPEAYCFSVADSGDDLIFISKDGDSFLNQGATGTTGIEAIAFNPEVSSCGLVGSPRNIPGCLYATDRDDFGFLDYDDSYDNDGNDSEFIEIVADVGTCTLPGGATVTINDIDGLGGRAGTVGVRGAGLGWRTATAGREPALPGGLQAADRGGG